MHSDLLFLSERMKIEKYIKQVYNLYDREENVAHIKALKQALNHELILKEY